MRVALVPGPERSGLLCPLAPDGASQGPVRAVPDLAAAVADQEQRSPIRWVWRSAAQLYPALLENGIRVTRCHDVGLTEALLAARDGDKTEADMPARPDRAAQAGGASGPQQLPFHLAEAPEAVEWQARAALTDLIAAHASQLTRIRGDQHPAKFGLLASAESAGALAAAEMTAVGLPWRRDVHDKLLTELLGPRPAATPGQSGRPTRLCELAAQISAELGMPRPVNPDSPAQLLRALAVAGIRVPSTRTSVLRRIDHPVIPLLLEYKELARLYAAHGWSWLDSWVGGGRFRSEYVVGGVVSGRWASRGGGALQIPKLLRRAIVADPGWTFVVADAAQLEPRILAALAGDRAFARAAAGGDIYASVAAEVGCDRHAAKVALLSAMYGGSGGAGGQTLALLRRRFPEASAFVESAARAGEEGRVVRSVLGRTCPRPSTAWLAATSETDDPDEAQGQGDAAAASRARGRFTRNFVVQASAADWALVLLAALRRRLVSFAGREAPGGPEMVFFQHDEVIVHCQADQASDVATAVAEAAVEATRLVFGATEASFPMAIATVECYADAKS